MKKTSVLIFVISAILTGCASNPINKVTSNNYAEVCVDAESKNDLNLAEQACYRALVNVDIGNLGVELKSQRLYNLARIKRQVAKFVEAEELLHQSIKIEEKLSSPSLTKIGRRLAELSINLAAQDKWSEGVPHVERLTTIADQYSGRERSFVTMIFQKYAEQLSTQGKNDVAEKFQKVAKSLTKN